MSLTFFPEQDAYHDWTADPPLCVDCCVELELRNSLSTKWKYYRCPVCGLLYRVYGPRPDEYRVLYIEVKVTNVPDECVYCDRRTGGTTPHCSVHDKLCNVLAHGCPYWRPRRNPTRYSFQEFFNVYPYRSDMR